MAVDSSGIRQAARQEAVDSLAQRGSLICVGNGEGIVLVGRTLEKTQARAAELGLRAYTNVLQWILFSMTSAS